MRRLLSVVLFCIGFYAVMGQSANATFVASGAAQSRISVVRSSIEIPSWHEKSFWPIYENYLNDGENVNSRTLRALQKVSALDVSTSFEESLHDAEQFLEARTALYRLRREYYQQMANALNGVISLQFLQTELMLDLMETAQVYNNSRWSRFRITPVGLKEDQQKTVKRNIMQSALQLSQDETDSFWKLYSIISLYAGEPSDYTPALAKRLGGDLMTLLEREQKLKEEYFYKFRNSYGPNIAARFLAWEDFYSTISKMYAWADAP
jgi:hypothetical protein